MYYDYQLDSISERFEKARDRDFSWKKSSGPIVISNVSPTIHKIDETLAYGPCATREGRVPGTVYYMRLAHEMGLIFK